MIERPLSIREVLGSILGFSNSTRYFTGCYATLVLCNASIWAVLDVALAKCQRTTIRSKFSLGTSKNESCFVHVTLFSRVFKTTSNVLNFDVNIALIAFCSLAMTKLAHWPMSSLLSCGSLADSLLKLSFVLALLLLNSV